MAGWCVVRCARLQSVADTVVHIPMTDTNFTRLAKECVDLRNTLHMLEVFAASYARDMELYPDDPALHENEDDQSVATGALYNVVYCGGAFLGPSIGGLLMDAMDVKDAYTAFGIFTLVSGVAIAGIVGGSAEAPSASVELSTHLPTNEALPS